MVEVDASRGKRKRGGASSNERLVGQADLESDEALFEELRTLRRRIAESEGVPPYVVFHDVTLREMAALRPLDEEGLLEVGGVGVRKMEKYGARFLAVLQRSAEGGSAD